MEPLSFLIVFCLNVPQKKSRLLSLDSIFIFTKVKLFCSAL